MNAQDFQLLLSGRLSSDPLSLTQPLSPLLNPSPQSPSTLQQSYLLCYYFRNLLSLGTYSQSDKKLVKQLMTRFKPIDTKTQGSVMNFEMNEKVVKYMFDTKDPLITDLSSNVLELMTMWISEMEAMSKGFKEQKEMFDLFGRINGIMGRLQAWNHVEDRVVFLNIVFKDILGFLPGWISNVDRLAEHEEKKEITMETSMTKVIQGGNSNGQKHYASTLHFLDQSLPKIIFNILIRAQAFSKDMLVDSRPQYDLLYLNEYIDSLFRRCQNFCNLIRAVLKAAVKHIPTLDLAQQQKVLDISFRYFYAFHSDNKTHAQSLVIQSFQAISNPVKYAVSHEIRLFLTVVEKLGYRDFYETVLNKFEWIRSICEKQSPMANPKNSVDPLFGPEIEVNVTRGSRVIRVIEIFREYSLIYFDVQCKSADINVRFVYAGAFHSRAEERRVIFQKQRLKFKENLKGSIEVLLPGIYYFEFDNQYSWLTAKNVTYRTVVLSSMQIDYSHVPQNPYLKILNSQINHVPRKLMAVGSHIKNKELEVQMQKQAKVIVGINGIYHLSIEVPHDHYEYELETKDKELVADRIVTKIKKYFSTRNFDRTVFVIGELEIISLKEFTEVLRQAVETGSVPKKSEVGHMEKQKEPEPTKIPEVEVAKEQTEPQLQTDIKQIKPIQPPGIVLPKQTVPQPEKVQYEQVPTTEPASQRELPKQPIQQQPQADQPQPQQPKVQQPSQSQPQQIHQDLDI